MALSPYSLSAEADQQTIEPVIVRSALDTIQQKINDWKDSDEGDTWIELGELCGPDEPCVQLYEGVASVKGDVSSPEFGSTRALAFTQALQSAQADNAVAQFMTNSVDVISQLTHQPVNPDPTICEDIPLGAKLDVLKDKALLFADKWLTNKLKDEGVADEEIPAQINKVSTEKRIQMLSDAIAQNSQTSAKGQDAGFIVLKNFEAIDHHNQAAVGVIIASAPKIVQLLNTMRAAKGQFDPSAYDQIGAIPRINESLRRYVRNDLSNSFGARLVYNRQGFPTVVGIGQASRIVRSNDPAVNAVHTRIAQESAQQDAINAISQLFDMSTSVDVSISDKAEFSQNAIATYTGCNLEDVNTNVSGERSYSKYLSVKHVSKSKTQLKGLKLVRRDKYHHPALKRDIYYVAYEWSPLTEMAISNHRKAASGVLKKKQPAVVQPQTNTQSQQGSKTDSGYVSESEASMVPDF